MRSARGYSPTWAGVRFKEVFGHWPRMGNDTMNAETVIRKPCASRSARRGPRALAKFHGADGDWSAQGTCGTCAMGSRGAAWSLVGIPRAAGARRAGGQDPDDSRRAKQNNGSNWCGAWGGFACVVHPASRTRDARTEGAWGPRSDRRRGRCAHGRALMFLVHRRATTGRGRGADPRRDVAVLRATAAGSARPPISRGDSIVMTAEGQPRSSQKLRRAR